MNTQDQIHIDFEGEITIRIPLTVDYVASSLIAFDDVTVRFNFSNQPLPMPAPWAVDCISACIREGRFDLIADAAKLLQRENKQLAMATARKIARRLTVFVEQTAITPEHVIEPTKSDVLTVMEAWRPDLYALIPTNKGKRAEWLERAGLKHLPQARGNGVIPANVIFALQEIKTIKAARVPLGVDP